MTGDTTAESGPLGDGDPTPEQLREQIETTREELGETVHELVAKTDVPARAHDTVASAAHSVRDKAASATADVQETATGLLHQVQDRTPPALRDKAGRVGSMLRRHLPEVLIVVAAGAVAWGARLKRR